MAVPRDPNGMGDHNVSGSEASAARPLDLAADTLAHGDEPKNFFADILRLTRRRWRVVLVVWMLVTAASTSYAVLAVPSYTATGVVQVSSKDALGAGNPLLEMAGQGGKLELQTEVEIMRRREFVIEVLTGRALQLIDPHQRSRLTTDLSVALGSASPVHPSLKSIRSSTVSASIRSDRLTRLKINLKGLDEDRLKLEYSDEQGVLRSAVLRLGERYEDELIRFEISTLPLQVGESFDLVVLSEGVLYDAYISRIGVDQLGSNRSPTNLVRVTLTDHDRHTAAEVVQALMEQYLRQNLEWQSLRASRSAEFIRDQLDSVRRRLEQHEARLQAFAEAEQAVDLSTQARVTIENAAALDAERAQIALQERLVGNVLHRMRKRMKSGEAAHLTANFFNDELLGAAIGSLTENEVRYEVLRATLKDEHPSVRELQAQVSKQRAEVAKLLRSTKRNLSARKAEIDRALGQVAENLSRYPDTQLQLARLTRNVEVSQRLYSFLLEKLHESEIMKAATTTDKRIVDTAAVPHQRSKPARGKVVLLGAVGGLGLGIALVYALRLLRQRMDTVEAVRELAPYPVYATIPHIPGSEDDGDAQNRIQLDDVWESPHGPAPEAFRTLRVNVSFVPARPNRGRIMQITSSQPGEGKSTVISNLAVSLAKSGARVIILDLDLRRPVQHRIWTLSRAPGLSDLVAQGTACDEQRYVQRIERFAVDLLPAGTKVPETLGSVMSPVFKTLLRKFAESYDYVLIDSPPIFVADTLVIGQHVDLVLVTARPGHVTRSNMSHAIDFLSRLTNIRKGLVLNGVAKEHSEYYYGKNYYYYGRSYGEHGDDTKTAVTSGSDNRRDTA
ncbi:MAG: polysaccharide biosynthesis tyrosine autokinase [Nannocystaceae bacterium]